MNEKHPKKNTNHFEPLCSLDASLPVRRQNEQASEETRKKKYEVRAYLNTNFNDMECMREQKAHLL